MYDVKTFLARYACKRCKLPIDVNDLLSLTFICEDLLHVETGLFAVFIAQFKGGRCQLARRSPPLSSWHNGKNGVKTQEPPSTILYK